MNYLLVKDKEQVLLGPMPWRQRMFQSEIDDLYDNGDITQKYTISPVAPESNYSNIGEGVEIFPVGDSVSPYHDTLYETLAGPYYTYDNNIAIATYNVISIPIEQSKSLMKGVVTNNRYIKEQSGIKVVIQGNEVSVDTARGSRDIYAQAYAAMGDDETINWKFPEMWIAVTKSDMANIVLAGKNHIQGSFDWEFSKHNEIDAAQTVAELKAIELD